MNENSNETISADSSGINTKQVIKVIGLIVLGVIGFYIVNFHDGLSEKNEVWGTFGDYFGGILNPVIAAFAFYLIAKTYELQKRELEATRSLLEVSTDAQKNQIKLAALTALLNSNFTRIGWLKTEKAELMKVIMPEFKDLISQKDKDLYKLKFEEGLDKVQKGEDYVAMKNRFFKIDAEIEKLTQKNNEYEGNIEGLLIINSNPFCNSVP
ncbi:MAG: hypothetical protein PHY54_13630 [Methylococcales bacterium]|nr:hypothetical protein [Methylococcales bacterium]